MKQLNVRDQSEQKLALQSARPLYRSAPGVPEREFFVYLPASRKPDRIVVLMHGISENACEQVFSFASAAEARGAVLVAPLMQRAIFGQYQQLVDPRSGIRADDALLDILDIVRAEIGLPAQPVDLVGFSGGGQFVHRFGFVHPHAVRSCVLVAPGWFSFPDPEFGYPQGLADLPTGKQPFDEAAARSVPFHVVVGDRDIVRDASLRQSPGLDRRQGRTRLDRAVRWHQAMQDWGADPRGSLTILPGLGHSFAQAARDFDLPGLAFDLFDRGQNTNF